MKPCVGRFKQKASSKTSNKALEELKISIFGKPQVTFKSQQIEIWKNMLPTIYQNYLTSEEGSSSSRVSPLGELRKHALISRGEEVLPENHIQCICFPNQLEKTKVYKIQLGREPMEKNNKQTKTTTTCKTSQRFGKTDPKSQRLAGSSQ